jgi:hypothetical protein
MRILVVPTLGAGGLLVVARRVLAGSLRPGVFGRRPSIGYWGYIVGGMDVALKARGKLPGARLQVASCRLQVGRKGIWLWLFKSGMDSSMLNQV